MYLFGRATFLLRLLKGTRYQGLSIVEGTGNLKAFTRDYLKEYYDNSDEEEFRTMIQEVNEKWKKNVYEPVLKLLMECYMDFQEPDTQQILSGEDKKRIRSVLWEIFRL